MSPRGGWRGYCSLFSWFPEEERGWPFPSRVVPDPKEGKEGCCHGGLYEANSSRVKWEIFIPGVRPRAAVRAGAAELGSFGHSKANGGQVGPWAWASLAGYLSVHLGGVRPPALHESGWGNPRPAVGRPSLQEIPVGSVCFTPRPCGHVTPFCGLIW